MESSRTYQIVALLGEGGFGKVYRANFRGPDGFRKEVAIKLLHDPNPKPAILKRFKDEARILGLVRDRAIVSVDQPTRIGKQWAVVMELVDGFSAGNLLRQGPMPPGVAVEIVGEIARVLNKVWTHPGPDGQPLHLLHRDIKPDNIQLTSSGEVKLLDFGIAKADFDEREFHTKQSIGGTPGYMAPERLLGIEAPEGDVYSLGVTLHEFVTGERPIPDMLKTSAQRSAGGRTIDVTSDDFEVAPEGEQAPSAPATDAGPLQEVLALAATMIREDRSARPTARDVERHCAELRRRIPGPSLRDWAEQVVTHNDTLPDDPLVGRIVTETLSAMPMTTGHSAVPSPAQAPTSPVTDRAIKYGVGVAGLAVVAALAAAAVGVFGLVFAYRSWETQASVGVDVPVAPEPVPVTAPPPEPVVVVAPPPVPEPVVVPEPGPKTEPKPEPKPEPRPPVQVDVAPVPTPAPEPVATVAPGHLTVRGDATSVWLKSQDGTRFSAGDEVPAGRYRVVATFPVHGQIELLQVQVREGKDIAIACNAGIGMCKEEEP